MRKTITIAAVLAAICMAALSCAKYVSEDNLTAQKRIREAWMRVNLGRELEADENGIYILEKTVGTGAAIGDTAYCLLDYSSRDLDGNYTKYTSAELAKRMGKYNPTKYYCPEIVQMGNFAMYTPVENLIKTLNGGGSASFLLPPEATTYDYPKDLQKYYKSNGKDGTKPAASENYLYDLKVVEVIDDIYKYQIDKLEDYSKKNYFGIDSLEKGFYFRKLKINSVENDTIVPGTSVKVNYVGKLLDGFCFDTNIQDTAKVYGLYSLGKKYESLSVTYQKNGYSLGDNGEKNFSTDVIRGFSMAVGRMKYGEQAVAFFWSPLAYGSKSSDSYPAYAPMCFFLEVQNKE
ncbi:MAG: FKBP-type peptidyl-prolyl cis-trans isomerase [Bacteroidales bacterium]|nr:FKBP-type peptidyl-prolyl cis-trans isomerase [Bacteroidales bacterium]